MPTGLTSPPVPDSSSVTTSPSAVHGTGDFVADFAKKTEEDAKQIRDNLSKESTDAFAKVRNDLPELWTSSLDKPAAQAAPAPAPSPPSADKPATPPDKMPAAPPDPPKAA